VNQIASAHERGLIKAKSRVQLVGDYPAVKDHLNKPKKTPNIKMKLFSSQENSHQEILLDDDLDDQQPIFF